MEFPIRCRFRKDTQVDGGVEYLQAAEDLEDLQLSWSDYVMLFIELETLTIFTLLFLVGVLAHKPLYAHFWLCATSESRVLFL